MALSPLFSSTLCLLDRYALSCSQSVVALAESCLSAVCEELGWSASVREWRETGADEVLVGVELELGEGEELEGEVQEEDGELLVLVEGEEVSLNKITRLMAGFLGCKLC